MINHKKLISGKTRLIVIGMNKSYNSKFKIGTIVTFDSFESHGSNNIWIRCVEPDVNGIKNIYELKYFELYAPSYNFEQIQDELNRIEKELIFK